MIRRVPVVLVALAGCSGGAKPEPAASIETDHAAGMSPPLAAPRRRSEPRTAEARTNLMKLYAGARLYWIEGAEVPGEPPQFPAPRTGPTPPLGTCCSSGGICQPVDAWWHDQIWTGLRFELDRPHRYSYEYRSAGTRFTVLAHGDLDCDGIYSKLWIDGSIPARGVDAEAGAVVQSERELE